MIDSTHHDEDREDDYDDYNTPSTVSVDNTTFSIPDTTDKETTLTLWPRQKVKQDKLAALLTRQLNVTGNLDLINLDQFNYSKTYYNFRVL